MNRRFAALLLLIPLLAAADDAEERYNGLVDEVLELTHALAIGEQMSASVVGEMVAALKHADPSLPDRAYDLLESEVNATIAEEIASGSFHQLMYPVYRKYLDEKDLEAMIAFYSSPEGRKIAAALPQLSQDAMMVGRAWGEILGPKIGTRVVERLAAEGIELQ